jgi:hypothetical protein
MLDTFKNAIVTTVERFGRRTLEFLPNFLALVIILLAGFVLAALLRWGVRRALRMIAFDQWCDRTGLSHVLARADIRSLPSALVAHGVFWLVILIFFVVGLSSLEVAIVTHVLASFFSYLPRVFSAVLILAVGFLVANFLGRAVLLAAVNADVASPRLWASGVKFLIAALTFAMALDQLEIASRIVTAAFIIVFGGITLALAIAFGMAGRDLARDFLRRRLTAPARESDDELSHL